MKKTIVNISTISLCQAVITGLVIWLWSLVMTNGEKWVDASPEASQFGPLLILPIIFIITATLSAGAVLGYPLYLALQKRWAEAIKIILLTVLWLAIFAVILMFIL